MIVRPSVSPLAVICLCALIASTMVPIIAAFMADEPSRILQVVDLVLAAGLALLLFALHWQHASVVGLREKALAFDGARWIALLPLLLFPAYALGLHLKWEVLLIGLGWRSWYFITVLPLIFASSNRKA